ncbi:MAG TPA: N-acetylmuramoyl-L-alanine amidase, partial [Acidimicrobiia bacterium]|nr:N-acetylmuramoyl-L-alanine amidase [Acidimicrobiia bacterium]
AGGIDRNVIGAQAEGFNTGSVGVAVIGNYQAASVPPAAERALARLLAWRLDVAHVDPLSRLSWISGGNAKYRRGTAVRLRAISGHRDTGFTSCPGARLYARLPALAAQVARIGLPKLYAPTVEGSLGGPVRFAARLSQPASWAITVRDKGGAVVARGTGHGADVGWTWDSTGRRGAYAWTIEAGPATRPAQGTIGAPVAPPPPPAALLAGLRADPPVISPDGDGIADALTISYTLAARASVTATVTDVNGAVVATLFSSQLQGARRQSFSYPAAELPDGLYTLTVSASAGDGRSARAQASFAIDRTLAGLALSTATLSPNGDGADDSVAIGFTLAAAADVTVQVERDGVAVAPVFAGPLPAGAQQLTWDGAGLPDGPYVVAAIVNGPFGQTRHEAALTITH